MQVSVYVSESDYETLSKNRPEKLATGNGQITKDPTVSQFMSYILRTKAEFFRATQTAEGAPIVPQHERAG